MLGLNPGRLRHCPLFLEGLRALACADILLQFAQQRDGFIWNRFPPVRERLNTLRRLGIGYPTLGEGTPELSGGEAQRLKLASEMGRAQGETIFIFDEPTIGLHPLDVRGLLDVFRALLAQGATVVVIEHDLDIMLNADYIIDMGPGGGTAGGSIVAAGTPEAVAAAPQSVTGKFLKEKL